MTEEEAKIKWCPMARVPVLIAGAISSCNRENETSGMIKCVASDCMMWREISTQKMKADGAIITEEDGYCGLAK